MHRNIWLHFGLALVVAAVALILIRLHNANGATPSDIDSVSAGRTLAEAWCRECHAMDAGGARAGNTAPDFAAVANMPSTTELSLKVFLQSNHRNMPNLVLTPQQRDDLVNYIMTLKAN